MCLQAAINTRYLHIIYYINKLNTRRSFENRQGFYTFAYIKQSGIKSVFRGSIKERLLRHNYDVIIIPNEYSIILCVHKSLGV